MRKMSIKSKITLWYTAVLIIVIAVTFVVVVALSNREIQKSIQDSLVENVEDNVDEVEYYSRNNNDDEDAVDDMDFYIPYNGGYLEIDDDYLKIVNDVYTSLCYDDGTVIYGENPIILATGDMEFVDGEVRTVEVDGVLYYVYDRELSMEGLEGLWLRGVVSETQGSTQVSSVVRASLIVLPVVVILAIIGGYILTRRLLKPIKAINESANEIRQSGDLSKRIDVGEGSGELHNLADNFNKMFDEIEDKFRQQRQFTSDASHELRTPMSVIMAQCEIILEGDPSKAEYREAVELIQRQGGKMSRLISDMLDFSRIEMRSDKYPIETVDFSELVETTTADMSLIRDKNIELTWSVEMDIRVQGNKMLLTRMLTNLISNAYRYGHENGHIYVSLISDVLDDGTDGVGGSGGRRMESSDISFAELRVKDDGIGISADDREKIFQRFYQADKSRSGEGFGMGLSMVDEIVRFHDGSISVESELGKGSEFIVRIKE